MLGGAPRGGDPHDPGRRNGVVQGGLPRGEQVPGLGDFDARREQLIDGRTHMVRAALDLVSEPDDPLLMWTSYPWPYLNLHRVPATRYIWKNFLLGEIYLARSGPQYVLPGTWETFAADVERTDPDGLRRGDRQPGRARHAVRRHSSTTSSRPSSPTKLVTLAFRDDLAAWLRSPPVEPVVGATMHRPRSGTPAGARGRRVVFASTVTS